MEQKSHNFWNSGGSLEVKVCGFFQDLSKIKFPESDQSSLLLVPSTLPGKQNVRLNTKEGGSGIDGDLEHFLRAIVSRKFREGSVLIFISRTHSLTDN